MFEWARERMVEEDLRGRDISDERVLAAMSVVPRELFVPIPLEEEAYEDQPLPIGEGVTISQPYIVGLMTQVAGVGPGDKVLEVGTGSGYQAAVLAEMGCVVTSLERYPSLARRSRKCLKKAGYTDVEVVVADGYLGSPEGGPFDAILVTASPTKVPEALLEQLAEGGRLVAPIGSFHQNLVVVTRTGGRFVTEEIAPVAFVPMLHGVAPDRPRRRRER